MGDPHWEHHTTQGLASWGHSGCRVIGTCWAQWPVTSWMAVGFLLLCPPTALQPGPVPETGSDAQTTERVGTWRIESGRGQAEEECRAPSMQTRGRKPCVGSPRLPGPVSRSRLELQRYLLKNRSAWALVCIAGRTPDHSLGQVSHDRGPFPSGSHPDPAEFKATVTSH